AESRTRDGSSLMKNLVLAIIISLGTTRALAVGTSGHRGTLTARLGTQTPPASCVGVALVQSMCVAPSACPDLVAPSLTTVTRPGSRWVHGDATDVHRRRSRSGSKTYARIPAHQAPAASGCLGSPCGRVGG